MVINQPDHCLSITVGTHHILKHEIRDGDNREIWSNSGVKYGIMAFLRKKLEKNQNADASRSKHLLAPIFNSSYLFSNKIEGYFCH